MKILLILFKLQHELKIFFVDKKAQQICIKRENFIAISILKLTYFTFGWPSTSLIFGLCANFNTSRLYYQKMNLARFGISDWSEIIWLFQEYYFIMLKFEMPSLIKIRDRILLNKLLIQCYLLSAAIKASVILLCML